MPDHMLDTESEKSKFYGDAARLASEISQNQTFHTVKPLLNFWAAFTPSAEVSIGGPNYFPNLSFVLPYPMISPKRLIVIRILYSERHRRGRYSQGVCKPLSCIYICLDSRLNQVIHQLSQHRIWFIQRRDAIKRGLLRQTRSSPPGLFLVGRPV